MIILEFLCNIQLWLRVYKDNGFQCSLIKLNRKQKSLRPDYHFQSHHIRLIWLICYGRISNYSKFLSELPWIKIYWHVFAMDLKAMHKKKISKNVPESMFNYIFHG